MSAFDLILEQIAGLRARMDRERTTLRLGTVQSSGTVLLTDGAEVTPAAKMVETATGDIVLVGQHNRRAYVIGLAGGYTYTPPAATMRAQAGQADVVFSAQTVGIEDVTFPIAFASTPRIFAQIASGSGSLNSASIRITNQAATGFTIYVDATSSLTGTFPVDWIAIPDGALTL